ncbi:MAG: hypothetical protein ACRD4K_01410 [Candidatus Acidiferrales bacterium]
MRTASRKLGIAWVLLVLALALHVADEALTGFLSVYNPTVLSMRQMVSWFPMPVFTFRTWLSGLVGAVIVLLLLSGFVFRGDRWIRPLAYFFAILMIANGLGHVAGTIMGRTAANIYFQRPMPGFYSSPFLLAASVYLLIQLKRTSKLNSA